MVLKSHYFGSIALDYDGNDFSLGSWYNIPGGTQFNVEVQRFAGLDSPLPGFALLNSSMSGALQLVPENLAPGGTIGVFQDPAAGNWSYSLVAGDGSDDNGQFQIVGGELQTGSNFNPGSVQHLLIRVRATPDVGVAVEQVFDFGVTTPFVNGITLTNIGGLASGRDLANGVVIQPDGKIVVAGSVQSGSSLRAVVARYNADGSLDPSWGGPAAWGFPCSPSSTRPRP